MPSLFQLGTHSLWRWSIVDYSDCLCDSHCTQEKENATSAIVGKIWSLTTDWEWAKLLKATYCTCPCYSSDREAKHLHMIIYSTRWTTAGYIPAFTCYGKILWGPHVFCSYLIPSTLIDYTIYLVSIIVVFTFYLPDERVFLTQFNKMTPKLKILNLVDRGSVVVSLQLLCIVPALRVFILLGSNFIYTASVQTSYSTADNPHTNCTAKTSLCSEFALCNWVCMGLSKDRHWVIYFLMISWSTRMETAYAVIHASL